MQISQNSLADIGVQNQVLPSGGPKTVPLNLNWSSVTEYIADLQNMQALNKFSQLQTLYVDNANSTQDVTITQDRTNQRIIVGAGMQGYYPVLAPNPLKLTFSVVASVADDYTVVFLLNIPIAPASWVGNSAAVIPPTVTVSFEIVDGLAVTNPLVVPDVMTALYNTTGAALDFNKGANSAAYISGLNIVFSPDTTFSNGAGFAIVQLCENDNAGGLDPVWEELVVLATTPCRAGFQSGQQHWTRNYPLSTKAFTIRIVDAADDITVIGISTGVMTGSVCYVLTSVPN